MIRNLLALLCIIASFTLTENARSSPLSGAGVLSEIIGEKTVAATDAVYRPGLDDAQIRQVRAGTSKVIGKSLRRALRAFSFRTFFRFRTVTRSIGKKVTNVTRAFRKRVRVIKSAARAKRLGRNRAMLDIKSGRVMKKTNMSAAQKRTLNLYRDGRIGQTAKRNSALYAKMTPKGMRKHMVSESQKTNAVYTKRKVPFRKSEKQIQHKLEYKDHSVLRLKEKGDLYRKGPVYSVEVRNQGARMGSRQKDIAFKVDRRGRAVPRKPKETAPPMDLNARAKNAYLRAIGDAGHRTFGRKY